MSLFIGVVIGVVMGLTGAGGALVAIPLFIQFLGLDLKEATVYSLVAVIIASLSNFYFQRKFSDYKMAFTFVLLSTVGSFLTTPLKKIIPDTMMAILLALVSLYSLYNMWISSGNFKDKMTSPGLSLTIAIGLSLGALTTLTGLGGGVLMLPILIGVYALDQSRAVATSLLTVSLSSFSSFLIQVYSGTDINFDETMLKLILGIILAAFIVKKAIFVIPTIFLNYTRKIMFTLVVFVALLKIFF